MNIYIYGSNNFRNEVHKTLDRGNVRFKIEEGVIEDIHSLKRLQELIQEDPTQIYIIDQTKVIEDDFISKNFRFLIPKDGITKRFLDDFGVGDISVRDYDDLVLYIEKRIEAVTNTPKIKADEITTIDEMFEHYE